MSEQLQDVVDKYGYERERTKQALQFLLADRKNEFQTLADAIAYPTRNDGWEEFILKFCLDFRQCFMLWNTTEGNSYAHNDIHKCMTIMRELAQRATNMVELTRLQNIAYTLSLEFDSVYQRM